ncbi:aminomethyl-transferring glycine dehydrogenase subunit GcvPA [uncultured Muribaculum sp.]|uniref:aminomethyl-transferring glycine dehydrogenase subunit GcvPA n=1 Tax=uncultured Muribaculum sp. TaxID=1918613 RepID=UPI0025CEF913|nr:aminomethyl-transferring glycine dehydrogenase subunit GcvPA [uncultured Muribaculum sp.]
MALHHYFPHTSDDVERMLACCGMESLNDLYADVPEELLMGRDYKLPVSMSEKEVRDFFAAIGSQNRRLVCFAGAGYYDHYTPSVVSSVLARSEFLTAYTPYQPEISQGTLQYIFEYQTMMASLTGMEVSNASMYDGSTSAAEAMLMMVASARKRNRVLVSATVLPQVRAVMATYAHYHGVVIDEIPVTPTGITDRIILSSMLARGDVAGVMVATPNRFGVLEDFTGLAEEVHAAKALLAMYANPSSLAVIKAPGEWGADIACGDAQPLGMPLNYGGPYLGFLCCKKAYMRKLPGRIVGATVDGRGQRVFVLTLQAREQHIRREKATSNICSNQGLMALFVAVYLSLMGPEGMRELNEACSANARWLFDKLVATGKVRPAFPDSPWLNEFLIETDMPVDTIISRCVENGILPGVKVDDNHLLIAVTEMRTKAEMQSLVDIIDSL